MFTFASSKLHPKTTLHNSIIVIIIIIDINIGHQHQHYHRYQSSPKQRSAVTLTLTMIRPPCSAISCLVLAGLLMSETCWLSSIFSSFLWASHHYSSCHLVNIIIRGFFFGPLPLKHHHHHLVLKRKCISFLIFKIKITVWQWEQPPVKVNVVEIVTLQSVLQIPGHHVSS